MQKLMFSLLLAGGLLLNLALPSLAQVTGQETEAKNLFLAHASNPQQGKPGVKIRLELKRGEQKVGMVPLNYKFKAGDKVKFHFETNFAAYVTILNLGTDGSKQLLFPYPGSTERVPKAKDSVLPQGDMWFEFDETPGTERMMFIFSAQSLLNAAGAAPSASQGSVSVNRPRPPAGNTNGSEQQALDDLNSRSLENAKNLRLVRDRDNNEDCAFVVADTASLRKPLGVPINLIHQ